MLRMLIHNWWLFVCRAILALIFAAYLWFIQGANFPLLMHAFANASAVSLFGLLAFSAGMITLLAMLRPSNHGHGRGLLLLDGVGNCVAAAIAVLAPALGLGHLIVIIAVWAIYVGLCELLVAVGLERHMLGEWLLLIAGFGSVGFGIVLLQQWTMSEQALLGSLTWYAFFSALVMGGIGYELGTAQRRLPV